MWFLNHRKGTSAVISEGTSVIDETQHFVGSRFIVGGEKKRRNPQSPKPPKIKGREKSTINKDKKGT